MLRPPESGVYNEIAKKSGSYPFSSLDFFRELIIKKFKAAAAGKEKQALKVLEVGANDGKLFESTEEAAQGLIEEYMGIDVADVAVANGNARLSEYKGKAVLRVDDVLKPSVETQTFAAVADVIVAIYVAPSIGFENLIEALDLLMYEGTVLVLIERVYTADKAKGMEWYEFPLFLYHYWKVLSANKIAFPLKRLLGLKGTIYDSPAYQSEIERHKENASGTWQDVVSILGETFGAQATIERIGDTIVYVVTK